MVLKGTLYWKEPCTERNFVLKGTLFWKEPCTERNFNLKGTLYWKEPCTERNFNLKGTLYWKEPCTERNLILKGTLTWKKPCIERHLVLKWTLTWKEPCTVYWKELCSERNHLYIKMMRDNLQNVNCTKKPFLCVKPYLVRSNQNRRFMTVGRLYEFELQTFCVLKIYVLSWIGIDKLNHHLEIRFFKINWTHLLILSL